VGLEWGQISLVSTTEELLGRKSSGSGLENREYGRRDVMLTTWLPLYLQKLPLTLRQLLSLYIKLTYFVSFCFLYRILISCYPNKALNF
jgi:hypothetical protein